MFRVQRERDLKCIKFVQFSLVDVLFCSCMSSTSFQFHLSHTHFFSLSLSSFCISPLLKVRVCERVIFDLFILSVCVECALWKLMFGWSVQNIEHATHKMPFTQHSFQRRRPRQTWLIWLVLWKFFGERGLYL